MPMRRLPRSPWANWRRHFSANASWVPMNTAIFNRVEVLRGAGALAVGVGDPSGVVNMVRKRPRAEEHQDVMVSAGSWDNYRTEVDVGRPLNAAATLRGRVVAAYQDRRFFYDVTHSTEPMLGLCPGISTNDCYRNASLLRSKGVDLEVAGELVPGWQVSAGYTYLKTRDDAGASISADTPRNILRAATSYRLPGAWERWTVGGALSAQSSAYISDENVTNPGRAILDLRAAYRVDARWTAALNIGNVTDKHYWSAIGGTRNGNYYGPPRNITLSLRGSF